MSQNSSIYKTMDLNNPSTGIPEGEGYTPDIGDMPSLLDEYGKPMVQIKSEKDQYVEDHKTTLQDDDVTMFPKPRNGCGHCYGRGHEGWDAVTGLANICRCIKNRVGKVPFDKCLTFGEFKTLLNTPHPYMKERKDAEIIIENNQALDNQEAQG